MTGRSRLRWVCSSLREMEPSLPRRILVIEDDRAIRELLVELLRDEGYETRSAGNGAEGLDQIEWPPDLILLDVMMPVMDGPTFRARQLELQAPLNEIPVILLTARRYGSPQIAAMHVNATVLKPFEDTSLLAVVESILTGVQVAGHGAA